MISTSTLKRALLLLPLTGLMFATAVFAYFGTHNFLGMSTTTSDGHSYKSEYRATGSFPFNGKGAYDGSRVKLKGSYTLTEKDGVPVSETYCATVNGTLSVNGGKLTETHYSDVSCSVVVGRSTYTVKSYTEDSAGNYKLVATNEYGIVYTTSGVHQFAQ